MDHKEFTINCQRLTFFDPNGSSPGMVHEEARPSRVATMALICKMMNFEHLTQQFVPSPVVFQRSCRSSNYVDTWMHGAEGESQATIHSSSIPQNLVCIITPSAHAQSGVKQSVLSVSLSGEKKVEISQQRPS